MVSRGKRERFTVQAFFTEQMASPCIVACCEIWHVCMRTCVRSIRDSEEKLYQARVFSGTGGVARDHGGLCGSPCSIQQMGVIQSVICMDVGCEGNIYMA
jgi:hypothetical protein